MTATHDTHRFAPPQFARSPRAQIPLYIQKNEKPQLSRRYFGCLKACKSAKNTSQTSQAMANCSERPFYSARVSQNPSDAIFSPSKTGRHQAELNRMKLRNRTRKREESLAKLMEDIERLVQQCWNYWRLVAKDQFIDSSSRIFLYSLSLLPPEIKKNTAGSRQSRVARLSHEKRERVW